MTLSAHAPKTSPWDVAFGGHQLCTTDGSTIEIEEFRLETEVQALRTELVVRTLQSGDVPSGWEERDDAENFTTKSGGLGRLPDLEDGRLVGRFTQAKPGLMVTQGCDEAKEIKNGYTELFVQFQVGERGAYMSTMWIDYRVNGRPYTLDLEWGAIACGDDIPLIDGHDYCAGTADDE
ncbi:hypothetical protein QNO07_06750 [Streptomyces sp. 549]|uniref:hypothetical protein n=1 Tax=Streptomyces sp. 549 TaxID=3049076 RepID=UPI0024C2B5A5|nr:hypothetical protein [Streptomyces sp. 549]MDK1473122.1 hypothetical protein [Streptomyces sp. 549]